MTGLGNTPVKGSEYARELAEDSVYFSLVCWVYQLTPGPEQVVGAELASLKKPSALSQISREKQVFVVKAKKNKLPALSKGG